MEVGEALWTKATRAEPLMCWKNEANHLKYLTPSVLQLITEYHKVLLEQELETLEKYLPCNSNEVHSVLPG